MTLTTALLILIVADGALCFVIAWAFWLSRPANIRRTVAEKQATYTPKYVSKHVPQYAGGDD